VTVKDRVGRHRYIAFEVAGDPPDHEEVIRAVRKLAKGFPPGLKAWVVLVEGRRGILRCSHLHKADALALLQVLSDREGLDRPVKTLGTSGTIRAARRKYFSPRRPP
jgi:RNase P/RNase MRP subunit POP5